MLPVQRLQPFLGPSSLPCLCAFPQAAYVSAFLAASRLQTVQKCKSVMHVMQTKALHCDAIVAVLKGRWSNKLAQRQLDVVSCCETDVVSLTAP